ncbi:hypothetical protein Tco_0591870 [Tanacetum coccineum]
MMKMQRNTWTFMRLIRIDEDDEAWTYDENDPRTLMSWTKRSDNEVKEQMLRCQRFKQTQDTEDTHVTLLPVNLLYGQQQKLVLYHMVHLPTCESKTKGTPVLMIFLDNRLKPLFNDTPTEALEDHSRNQTNKSICEALISPFLAPVINYLDNIKCRSSGTLAGSNWKYDSIREAGKEYLVTGSKTHRKSASQSALVEEVMQTTEVFAAPAHQEFDTGVQDEQAEEEVQHLPDWFQITFRLPSPVNELRSYKATTEKLELDNPEGRQYPHDLRQPLPLVPNSQGRCVIPFQHFINNDLEYLRGGVSSRKYSTLVMKTTAADYGHIKWIEGLKTLSSSGVWKIFNRLKFVESYQKINSNLQKPGHVQDLNMRRQDAIFILHTLDPSGFIYENIDKKEPIDAVFERQKFSVAVGLGFRSHDPARSGGIYTKDIHWLVLEVIRTSELTFIHNEMEILLRSTSNKLMPLIRQKLWGKVRLPTWQCPFFGGKDSGEEGGGLSMGWFGLQGKREEEIPILFDESDDEDYTVIFDKNSFSHKIIFVNDLKMDSENDNEKVNMPLFPSPEPTISYFDDLDFFKDFKNEFPAIVYNDAQMSKSDLFTEPILNPQHIDEFNLKDVTPLFKCDEEEQIILNFNDLFPFNVIYPNDSKSDKDNDDDKVDIEHSSVDLSVKPLPDVKNTDVGAYAHESNKLLQTSHDTSNKIFKTKTFIKRLNFNIMTWNHLNKGMSFIFLIKNLYVPFGIPFDPKLFYKDGSKLGASLT